MSRNGVIGKGNGLPWNLPGDLKHFKETTLGCPIIMGRKTWDSLGRPLPGRTNIIVTRRGGVKSDGIKIADSLKSALDLAKSCLTTPSATEIFVIGGAQIYKEAFPLANRLYLTRVNSIVDGDTYLDGFDEADWIEISNKSFNAVSSEGHNYSICVLDRR
tara:strand:- start:692 stop:1171 length:480 start_codon:yes stop_codon:yes gene_type:complete